MIYCTAKQAIGGRWVCGFSTHSHTESDTHCDKLWREHAQSLVGPLNVRRSTGRTDVEALRQATGGASRERVIR